ncbi:DUF4304 domain-containing protein [Desulfosporosinus sp. BICA1-9]|uniref:DUF4304 domain-containing protein n=1 Tax=Desulfosporosinus sp. BICA1-9 TaxID=1531958 RepID=UPI00054B079E|nr:DUF4304 domain-containing protein [Desulfosporosinus sp. BICA1-9]KJS89479.1 MAG: hypothetical protein JL57_07090 [Desulfosporosinus sp. BICA1-9]HBW38908.1 DUF4304 domain-containing protein [Desulfosporosinus sp.]
MDKKEFKKALDNILSQYGFQYINKAFYHDNEEIITVITTQKSNYENSYFINFGFLIKRESPEVKYPKVTDCDVFGRFVLECCGKQYQSVDLDFFANETLSAAAIQFIDANIKPTIECGLSKYFEVNPKAIFVASLKAKRYLNL